MRRSVGRERPEARSRADEPRVDREGGAVGLRLAIGRDGLGIELARPAQVECLDVVELVVRLPHVRFPFDVTGGVAKFRHRRGELERLAVEIDARRLARWAEPRLRGLVDTGPCEVHVAPRAYGATVTIATRSLAALAFDVAVVPVTDDVAIVVHGARGVRLAAPATTLAMRAVAALLGDGARREGARFLVGRPARAIARRLLPDAGVRAPAGEEVVFRGCGESDGVLFAIFARGVSAPDVPGEASSAAEAAVLARDGDEARWAGELERARHHDVAALERAPRHPELSRRIAEIDALAGGRAEAAISTLREATRAAGAAGAGPSGVLMGALLAETGDVDGAIAALVREGEREPSHVVGALAYREAALLSRDPFDALRWLDAAVARAPRLAELRWERADRRLAAGRLADARADFQELEALAAGPRARFDALRRAADVYRARGLGAEAASLYERALLYKPDDPETVAGLGAALAAEGRAARGAALLGHAIETATEAGTEAAWMELALAKVLADGVGDRPAAIAHLRTIPDDAREAIEARGLEGRYRAALGDASGASLAFARLRERAGAEPAAIPWLTEAAEFETARGDLRAVQAHLAAALAIAPQDAELAARYRAVSEKIAAAAGMKPAAPAAPAQGVEAAAPAAPVAAAHAPVPPSAPAAPTTAVLPEAPVDEPLDEAAAEHRVEQLTRTLQGDPTNDTVVDELVALLTRLGRSMELFALLSARLEDAPPDRREALLPRHREVLAKLEADAREAGRDGEADLFKMAREAT